MFVVEAYAAEGETQAGTEVPHDDAHANTFPPFDSSTFPSQLLWLVITFGLFYLFLQRVVLPRIGAIFETRSDRIAQDLDQAARMKDEADAAIAAYEQELADAKSKANEIGQSARDSAKAEAEAERKAAEAELEKKLEGSAAEIEKIKQSAMGEIGAIAEDTATAILQALTGAKATKAEVQSAVAKARG
ncbi:MAG: F0F1 ATP synthase subunit B [Rhizobiaceae bacterium]|nr:F0F1 ATP synthase subunit B [Rhizobiaceae bacterium]